MGRALRDPGEYLAMIQDPTGTILVRDSSGERQVEVMRELPGTGVEETSTAPAVQTVMSGENSTTGETSDTSLWCVNVTVR